MIRAFVSKKCACSCILEGDIGRVRGRDALKGRTATCALMLRPSRSAIGVRLAPANEFAEHVGCPLVGLAGIVGACGG